MRQKIANLLKEDGYTVTEWHYGREGYFVLADNGRDISCINIGDYINSKIDAELFMLYGVGFISALEHEVVNPE